MDYSPAKQKFQLRPAQLRLSKIYQSITLRPEAVGTKCLLSKRLPGNFEDW